MKKTSFVIALLLAGLMLVGMAIAGEKQLTLQWEQPGEDLTALGHWTLYKSLDEAAAWPWEVVTDVPYAGVAEATYQGTFTVTVPDGEETGLFFKMIAVSKDGIESSPSESATPAPVIIDFKPPAAPVVAEGVYDNQAKTVTLTWTQDAVDTDVVSWKVYKSDVAGGPYAEDGEGTSPYVHQLEVSASGKMIYFVVVAFDDDGNFSPNSEEVAVRLSMGVPFNLTVTIVAE